MKTIKPPEKQFVKPVPQVTCWCCKAVLEYDRSDIEQCEDQDQGRAWAQVQCPHCDNKVMI